jgi:hypothetical protein
MWDSSLVIFAPQAITKFSPLIGKDSHGFDTRGDFKLYTVILP